MSAAWPQVVGWLNTSLPTLWPAVTPFDGAAVTGDSPTDYVTIGYTRTGDTAGEFNNVRSDDDMGWIEQGHVLFDLVCQSGDDVLSGVRTRAFSYLDLLRASMRADQTLGGILSANATVTLASVLVLNVENTAGVAQGLVVSFEYTTLIWPN